MENTAAMGLAVFYGHGSQQTTIIFSTLYSVLEVEIDVFNLKMLQWTKVKTAQTIVRKDNQGNAAPCGQPEHFPCKGCILYVLLICSDAHVRRRG